METKIKKRAPLYGAAAVLLAIVLATLCYNFGVYPPESESPGQPSPTPSTGLLNTFSSYEELRSFLTTNSRTQETFTFLGPWDLRISQLFQVNLVPSAGQLFTAPGLSPAPAQDLEFQYSTTNIQVAGVDEADIVKTDGEYIYLVSGHDVFILKAYPPGEAEILSKITSNDTYPMEIFVSGNRLAVLGCKYIIPLGNYYGYSDGYVKTFVNVYDISNKTNPTSLRDFTTSGSYFNSRMIGEYVYFVVSQPAYVIYDTVILPKIYSGDGIKEISASEIHYSNTSDNYYTFTTIVALNMQDTEEEPTHETIMLGGTSNMYVSLNNIYITFPEPDGKRSIYRIRIENSTISCEAHGEVPGRELNQFSMDEYNNFFRIATTTWVNGTTQNNLYILNMNLSTVGKLENLASGENIHSARFMGDRCYLVTFKKIDPLFVIDLSEPTNPTVLGQLKIPGYSDYLHPYDENHIIGVGKETVEAGGGNFAWYQGIKISLFDVSNVSNPIEISKYEIGDRGTESPILNDHKAFLFDRSKNLLVIPVLVAEINETQYPDGVPPYVHGTPVWQGAYVFNITLSDGFVLRGNVTHQEDGISIWESSNWVNRALYIENVLYTVSDKKIKMNSLEDLVLIKEIELS